MFAFLLKGEGNPDLGQYAPVARPGIAHAENLEEAARICRDYITSNDLGGGNWTGGAGNVYNRDDMKLVDPPVVARISYNGRIWLATDGDKS